LVLVGQASSRGERHRLARQLRAEGKTWAEIAEILRGRLSVSARAGMRLAHGWTQQRAADEWGLRWPDKPKDKKWFSYQERWPNGGRAPSLGDLNKLAQLYQCTVTDLLTDLDYSDLDPAASVLRQRQDHEGVDRRDFLQGAVAIAASAIAAGSGTGRALATSDLPALVALDLAVRRVTRLERASQYAAVDAVLPRLGHEVEQAVDEAPPARDQDAGALLSRTYAVQAWVLIKQDLPAQAEAAASAALRAATGVDHLILAAAAMRCLGEVHMRAGRHRVACDLAVEAGELVGRSGDSSEDALVVSGAAYLSAAMACARAGDRSAAEQLLDAAEACAARLGRDLSGVAVFGPSNVDIHRVAIAMDLGDPVAALQHAEQARPQMPSGFEERMGRYLIDLGRAHAARQRDDDALHALLEAEEVAPEEVRTHPLARSVVVDLLSRERRTRTPDLRSLASRSGVLETA
jgi:transcriptional regulator with XRE-family HTH domain